MSKDKDDWGKPRLIRKLTEALLARVDHDKLYPSKNDIAHLALLQPIVSYVRMTFGSVITDEQKLRIMVFLLSAKIENLEEVLFDATCSRPVMITVKDANTTTADLINKKEVEAEVKSKEAIETELILAWEAWEAAEVVEALWSQRRAVEEGEE